MRIKKTVFVLFSCCLLFFFSSCAKRITEKGKASYYADKFSGRKMASGKVYRSRKMVAAHRTLPFGTKVKVINLNNGKSVKLRIEDRGPFVSGRIIDVSGSAARKLGMRKEGVVNVIVRYKK